MPSGADDTQLLPSRGVRQSALAGSARRHSPLAQPSDARRRQIYHEGVVNGSASDQPRVSVNVLAKITEDGATKMREELLEVLEAIQQAQVLTERELHALKALKEKGPSLSIEVAMRMLAFPEPEHVSPVLETLKERGLVGADPIGVGVMWSITQFGKRVLVASEWLRQKASGQKLTEDALWQEVESLYERGKLAEKQGNYEEAAKCYREALLRAQQAHQGIN